MKRTLIHPLVLLFVIFLGADALFSQNLTTGAIVGRAQDSTGAIVPGVEVTISSPGLIGGPRNEVTNEQGVYRFELLPPGVYRVSFGLPGFKTINEEGVNLTPGLTLSVNSKLEVTDVSNEVTVTSQVPTIDLESATVNVNFSQRMLDELPWSRSLTGISQMIPGTRSTSYDIGNSNFANGSAIAATSGGRSGGNIVTVDGLVQCQAYLDYGSFEEMTISTTSKGADQINSGITLAMVVKSGSNQYHGNFTSLYQNGSMQSNNISPDLLAEGYPVGSNKYTHFTDFYGDVGGPVLKDRLWFYSAYRRAYQGSFVPGFLTGVGGTPAVAYSILRSPTAKLTYQVTAKQKLEAYWSIPEKIQPYRGGGPKTPLDATQNQDSKAAQGPTLKWTDIIDSKTTLTAGIQRGGYWWPAYAYSMPSGQGPQLGLANGGSQPIPLVSSVGVPNVGVRVTDITTGATDGGYLPNYTRPIRWQENVDVSRVATVAGKANEVKAGYLGWWDKSYTITFGYPNQEQYRYKSLPNETCPNDVICSNYFLHPNSVIVYDYPNRNNIGGKYKAGYINDKITVTRRLTLNAGIRWDHSSSFLPAQGNPGTGIYSRLNTIPYETSVTNPDGSVAKFPVYDLLSPRLSFAYDLTGSGRIALKGSYGTYVGIDSSPGSQPGPGAGTSGVNPISPLSCTFNNWDGSIPYVPSLGAQNYLGSLTNANLSAACSGGSTTAINNFAAGLKPAYLSEYTAAVDLGINRNYSIRFNVSRKFDVGGSKTVNVATPSSAYTDVRCATDPGRDGRPGTPDDNPFGPVCTYSIPAAYPNRTALNHLYSNVDESKHEGQSAYTAYDATLNKQYANGWSLLLGYDVSLARVGFADALTPDALISNGRPHPPIWSQGLKINGSYDVPRLGLRWSSVFTTQNGAWYSRSANVTNALGTSTTVTVDNQFGRYPWVSDWDQSIRKVFKISDRQNVTVTWQLFNTTNAGTVTSYSSTNSSSSSYLQLDGVTPLRPSAILSPRTQEWGISYRF